MKTIKMEKKSVIAILVGSTMIFTGLMITLSGKDIQASPGIVSIEATITADNHYALYYGTEDGSSITFVGRNELGWGGDPGTYNWSMAENWSFEMNEGDYIYVAAWSDDVVAQGLLGQFVTSLPSTILTKPTDWQVYLTFDDKDDGSPAPTVSEMSSQIAGATWSPVSYYIDHGSGPWGIISGIDLAADWIWGSPLQPGSSYGEYQIFRIQVGKKVIAVPVDIKPQSCPNPLNVKARGVLPVAILGAADFDVAQIDSNSIKLEGVSPLRSALEDVATPFEPYLGKVEATDCTEEGADGYLDLTLKFDNQAIVEALGQVSDGEVKVLQLTGNLKSEFGSTPITGEDVVVILNK
jgi:hypothetical protein